ncbi:MAG: protein kinase domain-containing protein [Acidimicrobiia bacterium]
MALAPGSRIGSHEVISLLGEGGMGEVYRARDLRLDREVAIKRLPDAVAKDPERLARFEREAKTLASLHHPNVAQIYAVESGSIVMELVPGKTLAGPLPLEMVLNYAAQIASALDAAHERGIVHRDLKPGNVIVTPDGVVKVLDFGLAARDTVTQQDPNRSPTITAMSQQGVILGTAAYMSPEQAAGKAVDKRADIWAFGVVLWELLTGKRMFEGETVSHVLAAVLTKDPDLSAVPARVQPLLARCLAKDPKKRLRDIGDAMSLVAPQGTAPAVTANRLQRTLALAGWMAAAAIAAATLMAWPRSDGTAASEVVSATYSIPRSLDLYNQNASAFAVSPDGSLLAYHNETEDGQYGFFVRRIATGETHEVRGAVRSFGPRQDPIIWSPDSKRLIRGTQLQAQLIDLESGSARVLCDCRFAGGAWSREDVVLFGGGPDPRGMAPGIVRVSIDDGSTAGVTRPDPSNGGQDRLPIFLPDGRRFLFTRRAGDANAAYVGFLDGKEPQRIGAGSPRAVVRVADITYLISIEDGGAVARSIDDSAVPVLGPAIMLIPRAVHVSAGGAVIAASEGGARQRTVPTWFDRKGLSLGPAAAPSYIESIALSDDGRYIAFSEAPSGMSQGANDIWIHDTVKNVKTRLTFNQVNDSTTAWSPDGRRVVYTSRPGNETLIFQKNADGTGGETLVFDDDRSEAYANDWSNDGR